MSRPTDPESTLVHAWGSPPVVLSCGVPDPAGYHRGSTTLTQVDGVSWFQQVGRSAVTWTTFRHGVDVSVVVPTSYPAQAAFLVDLGPAIARALP